MHERSLVSRLLAQVERLMEEHDAVRVHAVRVSVGQFSGVEPLLLRSAFQEMVFDTPMRGADLIMEEVPLEARCDLCGDQFAVERFDFECPRCGSRKVTVVRGEELMLESLMMEETSHEERTHGEFAGGPLPT